MSTNNSFISSENPRATEGGMMTCGEQFLRWQKQSQLNPNPLIQFLDLTYNLRQYGLIVKTGFLKARLILAA